MDDNLGIFVNIVKIYEYENGKLLNHKKGRIMKPLNVFRKAMKII